MALIAWNNVVHLVPGTAVAYVPLNLAASAVVVAVARRAGVSWVELGLRRDRVGTGLRWGCAVAVAMGAAAVAAIAVPAFHPLLDDARARRLSSGEVAYHALVRIPLGTVVLEEVAFRGALFGALLRPVGVRRAALASSVVFGLWHIRPTLGLLEANDLGADPLTQSALVGGAVIFTTVAGLVFCGLRMKGQSTVAPAVAHAAINSFSLLASAATR